MHFTKSVAAAASILAGLQGVASTPLEHPTKNYASRQLPKAPYVASQAYPNTTIAGVTVIDTPIVRAAREYMKLHSSEGVVKHQMRSWLFGALIIGANETTSKTTDLEVHAISAMLHDLGWDMSPDSPITTRERRFEVDGAIAAKAWAAQEGDEAWDWYRLNLIWDTISLHTSRTIGYYKDYSEVYTTSMGISVDYDGLKPGVSQEAYDQIVAEYPNDDLKAVTNDTLVWFCQTKANTTFDTWMQGWGEHYVEGYSEALAKEGRFNNIFTHLDAQAAGQ